MFVGLSLLKLREGLRRGIRGIGLLPVTAIGWTRGSWFCGRRESLCSRSSKEGPKARLLRDPGDMAVSVVLVVLDIVG